MSLRERLIEAIRFHDGHADNWAVFRDGELLRDVAGAMAEPFRNEGVTSVVAVESRGFVLGAAVALRLGVGLVGVRKPGGLFAGEKLEVRAAADYRGHEWTLRMQKAAVSKGDRLLLVDDWIETGSQARAVKLLVEMGGGTLAGAAAMVDQSSPETRAGFAKFVALVRAEELQQ